MEKRLITAALPYVNNVPHLGTMLQVLSADVFARYCRARGFETLSICGTDEYGTATETRALEEGTTPQELCDRYYRIHSDVYRWFGIAFDKFGRTSTPEQTRIVQHIFSRLDANGFVSQKTVTQLYCGSCARFLADRYVRGICPGCGYGEARGDQCEQCGKLLDPQDLKEPRCSVCAKTPEPRETTHLYIDLPKLLPRLQPWLDKASREGAWARNSVAMTRAWIRDGLQERAITRDLKWGIPVPKAGFEGKVFYVWFDACIGYVSITATLTGAWEDWWRNPAGVRLYQFIGKDNIPFHTVIFPASLLGTDETWTMLHHLSSTEYLNYEGGKFSKSKGTGVFGSDAIESGIPADVWRFYLTYNRPETADAQFTWKDFQEKVNAELIGNFSNLVNRSLTFLKRSFGGVVPEPAGTSEASGAFWSQVRSREEEIAASFERVELRDALRRILELSSLGNKRFQDEEPWKAPASAATATLLRDLAYLVRDLAVLIAPFLPGTAAKIAGFLGLGAPKWEDLGRLEGLVRIGETELLFTRLEEDRIAELRERYGGKQHAPAQGPPATEGPRETADAPAATPASIREGFRATVDLRVARVTEIRQHAKADKLYVERIDLGGESRQIVSGLVPHYRPEELLNRNVIVVANLKPARLRGEESQGMLLAAKDGTVVEVLFADHARPGDRVLLEAEEASGTAPAEIIDVDTFFSFPISVAAGVVSVGGMPLACAGMRIATSRVLEGDVG